MLLNLSCPFLIVVLLSCNVKELCKSQYCKSHVNKAKFYLFYLSVSHSLCLYHSLSLSLSLSLSFSLSLSLSLSLPLSLALSVCLSVCLSVYIFGCFCYGVRKFCISTRAFKDKAIQAMFALRKYTEADRLPVKTAHKLFDVLIAPILTYNSEVWGVWAAVTTKNTKTVKWYKLERFGLAVRDETA